jgi:hypothetical protein
VACSTFLKCSATVKEETAAEDEPNEQDMRHQNGISEQVRHTTLRASLTPA